MPRAWVEDFLAGGHPSNAIVFGPGNYKFLDFTHFGWPLTLLDRGLATW